MHALRTSPLFLTLAALLIAAGAGAQQPVTRDSAIAAALATQPALRIALADSAGAAAGVTTARAFPNPTLSASYSRDAPHHHTILDIPLEYPWVRHARIASAGASREAARFRLEIARAQVRFDAETSYARALAAREHARLSRRTALDADSLLHMAIRRRDAGDASELDVQLASINAGQLENAAVDDSVTSLLAILGLERLMGMPADTVSIALADTLAIPAAPGAAPGAAPSLAVRAAQADLDATEQALVLERRSTLAPPSLEAGVESGNPPGSEQGPLPVVGISLPFPLFDRHRGPVAAAAADRDRARATLALVQRESDALRSRASSERAVAIARALRDRSLLASAERVSRMSLTAYAAGAVAIANVLEAERNARDVQLRYADDLAAAQAADAAFRLATTTGGVEP